MAKRLKVTILISLLLASSVGFMFLFLTDKASAVNEGTEVWVMPTTSVVPNRELPEVSQEFTVDIYVGDINETGKTVRGVRGWELKLSFDSTVLDTNKDMIFEGDFLTQWGAETEGTVVVGTGFIGASYNIKTRDYVNGEGVLISITFRVTDTGKSILRLYETEFVNIDLQPFPQEQQPVPIGGKFHTYTPHASFYYLPAPYPPGDLDYVVDPILLRDPIVGETITFNASAYTSGRYYRGSYDPDTVMKEDPDGNITTYSWNFGDGQTATEPIVYHSFAQAGSYDVKLTVTDNETKTDTYGPPTDPKVLVVKHDVAITNIGVPRKTLTLGKDIKINVTMANLGSVADYANVTLYHRYGAVDTLIWYNQTEGKPAFARTLEIVPAAPPAKYPPLRPGENMTINYTWNTSGLTEGEYTIWANISLTDKDSMKLLTDVYHKELDSNLTNNMLVWGNVTLKPLPDVKITEIALSPTLQLQTVIQYRTPEVTVSVKVENVGVYDVTSFYVTLYQGTTLLWNWTDISLAKDETRVLTPAYKWSTASLPIGNYTLKANASTVEVEVEGEIVREKDIDDNTLVLKVRITAPPVASFSWSPLKPLVGEVLTLDASSSSPSSEMKIVKYTWKYYETRTTIDRTYQLKLYEAKFTSGKTYNFTLTVEDSLGLTGSNSELVRIYALPTANFTFSPAKPKVSETVSFDASSSSDIDPGELSFAWSFGDGQTGSGKMPSHIYTALGAYTVNLTVTDADDHKAWLTRTIKIVGEPIASFEFSPTNPIVDQIITFNATSSQPVGGQITEYKWDLGDGSTTITVSGDPILRRKYSKGGTFTIALTVIDDEGLNNTTTKPITVSKLSTTISLSPSPSTLTVGETVTIVGQISPAVGGATVILYYKKSDGTWTWLQNLTTTDNGRYQYDWVTTETGTFQLRAEWKGNEKYNGAESTVSDAITVRPKAEVVSSDIYLYVVGGIVAIIVIGIGVRFFLKRPKTTSVPSKNMFLEVASSNSSTNKKG